MVLFVRNVKRSISNLVRDIARNVGGGLDVYVFVEGRHSLIDHRVKITGLRLQIRLVISARDPGKLVLGGVRQKGGDIITPSRTINCK